MAGSYRAGTQMAHVLVGAALREDATPPPRPGAAMLETEMFALLEQTADAAYSVTEHGEVCSWNKAAEELFGYPAKEVLGRNIQEVLEARDALGTQVLAGDDEAAVRQWDGTAPGIPNFDLEVSTRSGRRIWVNVSTIV